MLKRQPKKRLDAVSKKKQESGRLTKFVKKNVEKEDATVSEAAEGAEMTGVHLEIPDHLHYAADIQMTIVERLRGASETHTYLLDQVVETIAVVDQARRHDQDKDQSHTRALHHCPLHLVDAGASPQPSLALRPPNVDTASLQVCQMNMGTRDERSDLQIIVVEIAPSPHLRSLAHVRPDVAPENHRHHAKIIHLQHRDGMTVDESDTRDQCQGHAMNAQLSLIKAGTRLQTNQPILVSYTLMFTRIVTDFKGQLGLLQAQHEA